MSGRTSPAGHAHGPGDRQPQQQRQPASTKQQRRAACAQHAVRNFGHFQIGIDRNRDALELANGFGELNDASEQRRRFESEMALKQRLYGERYPLDEDFLAALALMPPASGMALGFDRLVMLATGAPTIEHVLWSPVPLSASAAPD